MLRSPLVRRLAGIKEMKVKTITMGKLHDMGYPPYVRHFSVIVFHFIYLCYIGRKRNYF
ncbi:Uncharacterised protein [Escherichia coli]|nr:Uncharacterised protein [Escherichia coli]